MAADGHDLLNAFYHFRHLEMGCAIVCKLCGWTYSAAQVDKQFVHASGNHMIEFHDWIPAISEEERQRGS